jgi:hypothetical protein
MVDPMGARREKVFRVGRPRALDRNAKVRIMHWARCLNRRTWPGSSPALRKPLGADFGAPIERFPGFIGQT